MSYIELNDLLSKLPMDFLIESMDDDNDGVIDDSVWTAIQTDVSEEIDGVLEQRYSTPIPNAPKLLRNIARVLAISAIYERRGFHTEEENPFMKRAAKSRDKLNAIANSDEPLLPGRRNDKQQTVTVVSEKSRMHSRHGNLST